MEIIALFCYVQITRNHQWKEMSIYSFGVWMSFILCLLSVIHPRQPHHHPHPHQHHHHQNCDANKKKNNSNCVVNKKKIICINMNEWDWNGVQWSGVRANILTPHKRNKCKSMAWRRIYVCRREMLCKKENISNIKLFFANMGCEGVSGE